MPYTKRFKKFWVILYGSILFFLIYKEAMEFTLYIFGNFYINFELRNICHYHSSLFWVWGLTMSLEEYPFKLLSRLHLLIIFILLSYFQWQSFYHRGIESSCVPPPKFYGYLTGMSFQIINLQITFIFNCLRLALI